MPLTRLVEDPAARRARKKPVMRKAAFAATDGVCKTMEGDVRYRAGDAIVTGELGEQWPVSREHFLSSYAPVAPTRDGEDGTYVNRSATVLAVRLGRPVTVEAGYRDDRLRGGPGDWMLEYQDGSHSIVSAEVFARTYELVAGEG